MKKKSTYAPVLVGGCSLLTIFGVLCLAVLALLSLSTAVAEKKQAEVAAQSVQSWYQADLQAQEMFARLRAGEEVPQVETDGKIYCFRIPVFHSRVLDVELRKDGDNWQILRWQETAILPKSDESLPVWQGIP